MLQTLARLAVFAGALLLAGCYTDSTHDVQLPLQATQVSTAARTSYGAYILRPNDQVRVQVYSEADITGDYQIDSAGFVSIPLAGRIKAAGRTTRQLESAIMSRLNSDIIKDPRVNVQVATYSPYYIHGEVKRAGEFPFKPGLTVMDAVASAGGFTYRADEERVYMRRAGNGAEIAYPMNSRIPVSPGDNIRIPERYF